MDRLRILSWNINMAGARDASPAPLISDYINGYDIVVFNEAGESQELDEIVKNNGNYSMIYSSCRADKPYANQIVMAVKEGIPSRLIKDEITVNESDAHSAIPNYLEIEIEIDDVLYTIIGVRILSENKASQYKQCKLVADFIRRYDESKNIIIIGDFNCGALRGDSSEPYHKVMGEYQHTLDGNPSDLRYYNWHMIRELFGDNFRLDETCGEQKSWGISLYKGVLNFGGARIKNDLLIISKNITAQSRYSWGFIRNNYSLFAEKMNRNKKKKGNPIDRGYPDHAQMIVDIKIKS